MDVHFTYSSDEEHTSLKQGDILKKTDELAALIKEVHPHYAQNDYTHFQVLTQSCDLVRRGRSNKCASRYITLAAVRGLSAVIQRTIESEVDNNKQIDIDGIKWCSDRHKQRVSSIVSSLFNNNDKNHFFLKAFPSHGLNDDSCTFLHLSIAIRAYEHYDLCLNAKTIELESNFQSKLGWMVGNLYSRVGTDDFVPSCYANMSDFNQYVEGTLDAHIAWVDAKQYTEFKAAYDPDTQQTGEQLIDAASINSKAKRQAQIESLISKLEKAEIIEPGKRKRLENFLKSGVAQQYLKI